MSNFYQKNKQKLRVFLTKPRGFCAGVHRAIEIVERAIILYGSPIYVYHEIVHNKSVVQSLQKKGARFVEFISDVPKGARIIFSAHGVSKSIVNQASSSNLKVIDATCPLVKKVHTEVQSLYNNDYEIILIGHKDHPEVIGTLGQIDKLHYPIHLVEKLSDISRISIKNEDKIGYVSQTTLSIYETEKIVKCLKEHFPKIISPTKYGDICYATQNRQLAVKNLAKHCEVIFVIGSQNSSNSNRLKEVSEQMGVPAYLINDSSQIKNEHIAHYKNIGITSGASAPEWLVQDLIKNLKETYGIEIIEELPGEIEEKIKFSLPKELAINANYN